MDMITTIGWICWMWARSGFAFAFHRCLYRSQLLAADL